MKNTFRQNFTFFLAMLLFILAGAVVLFQINSGDGILFFSERRSPALNAFFSFITKLGEEPMYLLVALVAAFYRLRYTLLIPLTGVVVLLIAYLVKSLFGHPRPSVFFQLQGTFEQIELVDGIQLLTGYLSFPSGHTMSAFALYGLLAMLLPWKRWGGLLLFILAFLVGISRIYLVQHFVKDVYLGAILGIAIALGIYLLQKRKAIDPVAHWYDRPLIGKARMPIAEGSK